MTREQLVELLKERRIYGRHGCLIRGWQKKIDLEISRLIEAATDHLSNHASVWERLLNIRLGIVTLPRCEGCTASLEGVIWKSKLCYKSFCGDECHNRWVTKARVAKMTADNSFLARSASRKSVETQKARGSLEKRIVQALETKRAKGMCVPKHHIPAHKAYKSQVRRVTSRQPVHLLENYHLRGLTSNGGWHIDHRFSISEGFRLGIDPEIVGHIANLVMLPGAVNVRKQGKCSITLKELELLVHDHQSCQLESQAIPSDHLHDPR
jgi:hypothetical protein